MGSYIESSLVSGERLIYRASTHWGIYIGPAILTVVLAIIFPPAAVLGLIGLVGAFIYSTTTELGVTDRKVIGKWGLFSRSTIEQRLSKVDSIVVNQGIFGRIFNYGSILVRGGGGTPTPAKFIADPLTFKREFETAVEAYEARGDR